MLCIVQNGDGSKCIEWRPNDLITIDSDTQDQEWAVVNTIGKNAYHFNADKILNLIAILFDKTIVYTILW